MARPIVSLFTVFKQAMLCPRAVSVMMLKKKSPVPSPGREPARHRSSLTQFWFNCGIYWDCRSRWGRYVRRRSAAAWFLVSRVRIPLRARMFASCVYVYFFTAH
jgi:hypothetical protein